MNKNLISLCRFMLGFEASFAATFPVQSQEGVEEMIMTYADPVIALRQFNEMTEYYQILAANGHVILDVPKLQTEKLREFDVATSLETCLSIIWKGRKIAVTEFQKPLPGLGKYYVYLLRRLTRIFQLNFQSDHPVSDGWLLFKLDSQITQAEWLSGRPESYMSLPGATLVEQYIEFDSFGLMSSHSYLVYQAIFGKRFRATYCISESGDHSWRLSYEVSSPS